MSMTSSDLRVEASARRFRIDAPHAEESVSSALDRAASLWSVTRWDLLRHAGYPIRSHVELEGALREPLLRTLAQMFGMDPSALASRAVPKDRLGALLAPQHRHAYCPLCFESDWLSGRTPYFRLDWGRLWATHCRIHKAPLFEWIAVNGYGDRRLPHAYYVPREASAPLPTWMELSLEEARAWQSSVRTRNRNNAFELWRALMSVEQFWWNAGIGDLFYMTTPSAFRSECVMASLAALFLAARDAGHPCMAEMLHVPIHQWRVLGYDRRRQGREIHDGDFRPIREQLPSIQARRMVLILTAHTLGQLGVDLRFETGAAVPFGRSRAWAAKIMDHQRDPALAQKSLQAMDDW